MSPELVEELFSHLDRLRRGGRHRPDAHALPDTRQRVAEVVDDASSES